MECAACKRGFIICASNVRGEPRTYEDVAYIAPLPVEFVAKSTSVCIPEKGWEPSTPDCVNGHAQPVTPSAFPL